jgi:hypothetical protein
VRSIAEVSCRSASPFCCSRYNIHYI